MSGLLVLGRGEQGARWSRLLSARRHNRLRFTRDWQPEALVVVNDRSAGAVIDLQRALELRRRHPQLPVAVLTLVDAAEPTATVLAEALAERDTSGTARISADQAAALLGASLPALKLRVSDEVLSFEYQPAAEPGKEVH